MRGCLIQRQPLMHIQGECPIRIDVSPQQGRQCPNIHLGQSMLPRWFGKDLLEHQGIDIHQGDLEQMEAEHRDFLMGVV